MDELLLFLRRELDGSNAAIARLGSREVKITAVREEDGRIRLRIEGAGDVERVVAWARGGKWVEVLA